MTTVRTSCPCCQATVEFDVPGRVTWRDCPNCYWRMTVYAKDHQPDMPPVVARSREVAHQNTRDFLAGLGHEFTVGGER